MTTDEELVMSTFAEEIMAKVARKEVLIARGLANEPTECAYCGKEMVVHVEFFMLDPSYLREYAISGMCQVCQDASFGVTQEGSEDGV